MRLTVQDPSDEFDRDAPDIGEANEGDRAEDSASPAVEAFAEEFWNHVGEAPDGTQIKVDGGEALLIDFGGKPNESKPWSISIWESEDLNRGSSVKAAVGNMTTTDPVELANVVKQKWFEYEKELARLYPEGKIKEALRTLFKENPALIKVAKKVGVKKTRRRKYPKKRNFVAQAWEKAGATSRTVSDEETGFIESFNNWRDADPMRKKRLGTSTIL